VERKLLIKGFFIAFVFQFFISSLPLKYYVRLLKSTTLKSFKKVNLDVYIRLVTKSLLRIERITPWNYSCLNKVIICKYLYEDFGIESNINLTLYEDSAGKKCAHASLFVGNSFHFLSMKENNKTIQL